MNFKYVLLALCLGLISSLASAQATRTWVSGVGDDANPCSRTAPCKTFAGAISKTAAGGEINALDPGGFGAVTITKAITIDGGGSLAGILVLGTNGIIVNAGANDQVVLRNLDIDGLGGSSGTPGLSGVNVLDAKRLIVENVKIYGFSQNGIQIAPSNTSVDALIINTTINRIADPALLQGNAIHVMPGPNAAADVTISNSHLEGNDAGVAVEDGGVATVTRTVITNSRNAGVAARSTARPTRAVVDSSVISGGQTGILSSGAGATVHATNNLISRNQLGFNRKTNGVLNSFGDNRLLENTGDFAPSATIPLR